MDLLENLIKLPIKLNVLPQRYNLYYFQEQNEFVIYIAQNPIQLQSVNSLSIGYISYSINHISSELTIQFLKSNFTGIGIGYYLILIISYIAIKNKIKKILLDDFSDLAHQNSIYENIGCDYVGEKPEPEMECKPKKIYNKLPLFKKKYLSNNKYFVLS